MTVQSEAAYVSERFAGALTRLAPDVRRPVVQQLSSAGMSTRQIAPIVGKDYSTVSRDRTQVLHDATPAAEREGTPAESIAHGLPTSPNIIGSDGKNYRRPEPAPRPKTAAGRFV